MRSLSLFLAGALLFQSGPAAAMLAVRPLARIPVATVAAVNPLVNRWAEPLKSAFQTWDGQFGTLPGGELISGLSRQDFSDPANQRQLVPLLQTLEEMGVPPQAVAEYPKAVDQAVIHAQNSLRESLRKKAALLDKKSDQSEASYRAAQEILRDLSAYGAYVDDETRVLAERSFDRAAASFQDARRSKALRKLKETAEAFNLNLFDPQVMDWVLNDETHPGQLVVSQRSSGASLKPFATLPDPDVLTPAPPSRGSGLARAPPAGEETQGRAARIPQPLNDEMLDAAIRKDFEKDNFLTDAVAKIEGASGRFAAEAAELLFMEAFVQLRGHAMKTTADRFTGFIRSHLDAENYFTALRSMRSYADETEENPRARRWVENLAKYKARLDYKDFSGSPMKMQDIAFLANPLEGGQYWDLAAGPHAASLMRNGLSPNTKYVLFDISPFVVAYLKETRRLMIEAGVPHAENIEIVEQDLTKLTAPKEQISVIRGKNVYAYVPGFEKRFEELASWLAEGGQLVIPMDRSTGARMNLIDTLGDFIDQKIAQGWGFEYSFAGEADAHDKGFDHVVLTKPKKGERISNIESFDDFKMGVLGRRQPRGFSIFGLLR